MFVFRWYQPVASLLIATFALFSGSAFLCAELTEEQIYAARDRGLAFLKSQIGTQKDGYDYLSAIALLKCDVPPDTPEIQAIVEKIIQQCSEGTYKPGRIGHTYEAACALICLANVDREKHSPQIQIITNYLLSEQAAEGYWDYPTGAGHRDQGDTSITQFVLLGLWEARRSGISIPTEAWEKCARWLMSTQFNNGGFAYHPSVPQYLPTNSMSAAGAGSLLMIRHQLFPQHRVPFSAAGVPQSRNTSRKFGVLESANQIEAVKTTLPLNELDDTITDSVGWLITHYITPEKLDFPRALYYLYAIERLCALGYMPRISSHNWYQEGAQFLIQSQSEQGSWCDDGLSNQLTNDLTISGTSFAVLFLTKATTKMVDPPFGTGLLIGGRGLPENLKETQFEQGKVKSPKSLGSLDDLLGELESPQNDGFASAQTNLMDKVLNERPAELIQQKDRLLKLAVDPRPDVRKTAMWALGRTNDLRVCPILLRSLKDSDPGVAIEASLSLRILSRQLQGLTPAGSEFDAEKEYQAWTAWYHSVRPYDERDDLTQE